MMPIRREGSPYILGVALLATLTTVLSLFWPVLVLQILVLLSWILFILILNFFRDPERIVPPGTGNLISPADGKIIDIRTMREESYIKDEVNRVSIFMSVFNVHVNRAPVEGTVEYIYYMEGNYAAAYREDASSGNEQMSIGFRSLSENGRQERPARVMIKLIAGYLARRIIVWKDLDDQVRQGERIGMIKFGSRVEVYLPLAWKIVVKEGDRVRAGETVIGIMREKGH